ncbi:unnamed protein product [Gadus morhua 'NCC']
MITLAWIPDGDSTRPRLTPKVQVNHKTQTHCQAAETGYRTNTTGTCGRLPETGYHTNTTGTCGGPPDTGYHTNTTGTCGGPPDTEYRTNTTGTCGRLTAGNAPTPPGPVVDSQPVTHQHHRDLWVSVKQALTFDPVLLLLLL